LNIDDFPYFEWKLRVVSDIRRYIDEVLIVFLSSCACRSINELALALESQIGVTAFSTYTTIGISGYQFGATILL
jgi:hypothetical protein